MRVFLAAPFTSKIQINPDGTCLDGAFADLIGSILISMRKHHIDAFSSHEREQWGAHIYEPARALKEDLDELNRCDLVIAIIGDPPSPGVQMELGYALALAKPIICLYIQSFDALPHLVKGLVEYPSAVLVNYKSDHELVALLGSMAQNAFSEWITPRNGNEGASH